MANKTDYEKYLESRINDYNAAAGHPKEAAMAGVFLSELNQGFDNRAFAKALCVDHPTIQQMFFRLIKEVILERAVNTRCSDERNKESVHFCQELKEIVEKYHFPMR